VILLRLALGEGEVRGVKEVIDIVDIYHDTNKPEDMVIFVLNKAKQVAGLTLISLLHRFHPDLPEFSLSTIAAPPD